MDRDDEILSAIVRLETKMDVANGRITDHGKRLRSLEAVRNWAGGVLAVVGLAAAAIKVSVNTK